MFCVVVVVVVVFFYLIVCESSFLFPMESMLVLGSVGAVVVICCFVLPFC